MDLVFRQLTPDDAEAMAQVDALAFGSPRVDSSLYGATHLIEFDRTIGVFDPSAVPPPRRNGTSAAPPAPLVGQAAAYSFQMTVPGGRAIPVAGVTWVAVRSTHRRRGILTEMMNRQLTDVHERGEPLAALYASESTIYGRFGYGVACWRERWDINARRAHLAHHPKMTGSVAFVENPDAKRAFEPIYERARKTRPGMVARNDRWWCALLRDADEVSPGSRPQMFNVIYRNGADATGFVRYRIEPNTVDYVEQNTMDIRELVAATDEAHAALWRYCLEVDLVARITSRARPLDDPLPWMLSDVRALKRDVADHLHVRVVDVEAALSARRYDTEGQITLEVNDPVCPWNDGRYELGGSPDGAQCRRVSKSPDLTMPVAELGALYLGGNPVQNLVRAGRIQENVAGAAALADRMFRSPVAPWPGMNW